MSVEDVLKVVVFVKWEQGIPSKKATQREKLGDQLERSVPSRGNGCAKARGELAWLFQELPGDHYDWKRESRGRGQRGWGPRAVRA